MLYQDTINVKVKLRFTAGSGVRLKAETQNYSLVQVVTGVIVRISVGMGSALELGLNLGSGLLTGQYWMVSMWLGIQIIASVRVRLQLGLVFGYVWYWC